MKSLTTGQVSDRAIKTIEILIIILTYLVKLISSHIFLVFFVVFLTDPRLPNYLLTSLRGVPKLASKLGLSPILLFI